MRKKVAMLAFCLLKAVTAPVLQFEHQFRRTVYFWMPGWKVLTCFDSKTKLAGYQTNDTVIECHKEHLFKDVCWYALS